MFKWTGGPPVVVDTLMSCCCFYRKNEESINFGERERGGKEGRKEGKEDITCISNFRETWCAIFIKLKTMLRICESNSTMSLFFDLNIIPD